jgi:multiple sugar transport system substrate-binding protein
LLPRIDEWQQRTGLGFEPVDRGNVAYAEKLATLFAAGTPPDIFIVGGSFDPLGGLLAQDAVQALDPLIRRDKWDIADFYPQAQDNYRAKNTLWGLPLATNPSAVFLNHDLFAQAGLQPPSSNWKGSAWTWNDLVEMGKRMTRRDVNPPVFGTVMTENLKTPTVAVWSYGGDLLDKDLTRCTIDSPQAIEALQMLVDLVHRQGIHPTEQEIAAQPILSVFHNGRTASFGRGIHLAGAAGMVSQNLPFKWSIGVSPAGRAGRFSIDVGLGFAIAKESPRVNETWELLKFIGGPEMLGIYAGNGLSGIIGRKSVQEKVMLSPDLPLGYKEFVQTLDGMRRYPLIPRWSGVYDILNKELVRLWRGDVAVREVVATVKTQIDPLLKA